MKSILLSLFVLGFVPKAFADFSTDKGNMESMYTMKGDCQSVVMMDMDVNPKSCENNLVNFNRDNGRTEFHFVLDTGEGSVVIGFSGLSKNQKNPTENSALQPIDYVLFTAENKPFTLEADGYCRYSNPYRGFPVPISCHASTAKGVFAGKFVTNGEPPK